MAGAELKLFWPALRHQLIKLMLLLIGLPSKLHSLIQLHLVYKVFISSIPSPSGPEQHSLLKEVQ